MFWQLHVTKEVIVLDYTFDFKTTHNTNKKKNPSPVRNSWTRPRRRAFKRIQTNRYRAWSVVSITFCGPNIASSEYSPGGDRRSDTPYVAAQRFTRARARACRDGDYANHTSRRQATTVAPFCLLSRAYNVHEFMPLCTPFVRVRKYSTRVIPIRFFVCVCVCTRGVRNNVALCVRND